MKKYDRPMNVMEVSELCGVARSTVSHWIAQKGLPAYREGKKFMIEGADLARFLSLRGYRLPEGLESLAPHLASAQSRPEGNDHNALLAFIHQIRKPAFIFSGLRILACNRQLAELVGARPAELVGKTITAWVHPDSLDQVVAFNAKRTLGQEDAPESYTIFMNGAGSVKMSAQLAISPLDQPENAWMAILIAATPAELDNISTDSTRDDPDGPEGRDFSQ